VTAVGLDVGTSSVKGVALDSGGGVLAVEEESHPIATPRPGWTEQDPEHWWRGAERVLARLRARAGPPTGIGLSGQMHGLVALDDAGRVLRPALLWNDQRTAAEAQEIEARLGGVAGAVAATGNRVQTGFTAPKLLWLERHEPELHARIASLLLPKDYVRVRLCGERATDVTDASGTAWFDVRGRRWSDPVLQALGVDASWLPPVLESGQMSGRTAEGVAVAAGAGDQGAGALGVGALGPGAAWAGGAGSGAVGVGAGAPGSEIADPASIVLGTSGVVLGGLDGYAADPEGRLQASCHVVPERWFAMGVMLSAAGSLAWLHGIAGGGASVAELLAEAERWPPGAEGLVFLPYLSGERTPHADPHARGAFVGLSVRHDRGALTRAVLEGVAFALRDALDLLVGLGARPRVGRASGGGARSDLWLRIVASVLELPLERVAVEEGAAYGAALLGGVAGGMWRDPFEAASACVRGRPAAEPDEAWVRVYAEERERYRALYPALRGV
jgi:xylulokinase